VKVLVAVKRVSDPENLNKVKVTPDGKVDASGLEPKPSPYDEYALESALRLTENGQTPRQRLGEVVVATFGPKPSELMLRAMLGTGADRAIRVDATDEELDGDLVARGLKALVEREQPDLVLVGYEQTESESNEVGQMLAEYLGWPQATFAGSIRSEDDTALVIGREVEGATVTVRVTLPAVVTVLDKVVYPKGVRSKHTPDTHAYPDGVRFAALMAIMAAKRKPLVEIALSELVSDLTMKVRYGVVEQPPKRAAGVKVKDVAELVQRLKTEAKVI
jgi:electron transfer flavoprotein beta subunit